MFNKLWLNYEKNEVNTEKERKIAACLRYIRFINVSADHVIAKSILAEMQLAVQGMFGEALQMCEEVPETGCVTFTLFEEAPFTDREGKNREALGEEGYYIFSSKDGYGINA